MDKRTRRRATLPGAELHELPIADQDVALIAFEQWGPYEAEIARTFVDFMKRAGP